ncbi:MULTISPECIES: hypothetical protein [unclassified Methylobacterium]|uniref:hypothetical protein n=1 Tax=unclassified Methylobacterium TaxID=2615210 RepID=UPI0036FE46D4
MPENLPPQGLPASHAYENLFVFQFSFFRFPFPGGAGITAAKVLCRACRLLLGSARRRREKGRDEWER